MKISSDNNILNIQVNKYNIDINFSNRAIFRNNLKKVEKIYEELFGEKHLHRDELNKIEAKIITISKVVKKVKKDINEKNNQIDDHRHFNILINTIFLVLLELHEQEEESINSNIYMDWRDFIAITVENLLDDEDENKDVLANFDSKRIINLIKKYKISSIIIRLAEEYVNKNTNFQYDKTTNRKYKVVFTNEHARLINIGGIISKLCLPVVAYYLDALNIKDDKLEHYDTVKDFIRDVFVNLFNIVDLLYRQDKKDKVIDTIINGLIEQGKRNNKEAFKVLNNISANYSPYGIKKEVNGELYTNAFLSIEINNEPLKYIVSSVNKKMDYMAKEKIESKDRIIGFNIKDLWDKDYE